MQLEQARHIVEIGRRNREGCTCPVCGQYVKEYKRKLNSTMAAGLIWLTGESRKNGEVDFVHIGKTAPRWLVKAGGTIQTLSHWDLIIQKPNFDTKTRTSGLWMPTVKGLNFARGNITVPSHVYLYNNVVQGFSEEEITIQQALGEKFSYQQLMDNAGLKPIH